jgi:RNA polymerase sigma-70 factor (ECF subfamily)
METTINLERARVEGWTDQQVVDRVLTGDTALYEIIMRRYNQRLYRITRAILRDDAETEDAIQDAYVRAYQHLDQFAGHCGERGVATSATATPQPATGGFRE